MSILITGGASGLGEAITKKIAGIFPSEKIYISYNNSAENAAKLEAAFAGVSGIKCNFSDGEDLNSLCSFIKESDVDILINNALPAITSQHFHKIPAAMFSGNFNSNIIPVLRITQAFILAARKRKFGKIITILSSYIHSTPPTGYSTYVAEKNYLYSMHKSWVAENSSHNITSNCISPGFMLTNLNKDTDDRILEEMRIKHPLKKLLTVEEVADTVAFLVTSSQQLNAQEIIIDSSQRIV